MSWKKTSRASIEGALARQGLTELGVGPMALRPEVTSLVRMRVSLLGMSGVGLVALRPTVRRMSMAGVGPVALRRVSTDQRRSGAGMTVVNARTRKMVVVLHLRQVWVIGGLVHAEVRAVPEAVRRC